MLPTDADPAAAQDDLVARARLIHSVYQIALEPQSYDVFMDHWDGHVSRALQALTALHDGADLGDPEILLHFDTAFGILEELGRQPSALAPGGKGPRFLLDHAGSVTWANTAAAHVLGLGPRTRIDDLAPLMHDPTASLRLLRGLLSGAPDSAITRGLVRVVAAQGTLYLLASRITDRDGQKLVMVEPLLADWSPEMDRLLMQTFGLTAAETAVASGLAEGLNASQIAERRSVSVLTVRSQIKNVLAKTGAGLQTDLVRMLVAAARAVEVTPNDGRASPPVLCVTNRGREMPVSFFGAPDGLPVLFLHGMLDGCFTTPAVDAALCRHNLRLIAPVRPGFGTAAADSGPVETAPRRLAEDLETMLDRLRIGRVAILGHMAGSVYAFAAAAQLGNRVAAVVNVAGGVPIRSVSQIARMSRRQRLVAYTARYAPAALPFVLRAGIRQLDFNGDHSFMSALYETSAPDLAMIADPDVALALARGYQFAVAQGHRAFEIDSHHVVRDWSAMAAASCVPVELFHGQYDPVVVADSVVEFAAGLGARARATILPDSGQLLLYKDHDAIFGSVASNLNPA